MDIFWSSLVFLAVGAVLGFVIASLSTANQLRQNDIKWLALCDKVAHERAIAMINMFQIEAKTAGAKGHSHNPEDAN